MLSRLPCFCFCTRCGSGFGGATPEACFLRHRLLHRTFVGRPRNSLTHSSKYKFKSAKYGQEECKRPAKFQRCATFYYAMRRTFVCTIRGRNPSTVSAVQSGSERNCRGQRPFGDKCGTRTGEPLFFEETVANRETLIEAAEINTLATEFFVTNHYMFALNKNHSPNICSIQKLEITNVHSHRQNLPQ